MNAIEIKGLTKTFGQKTALCGLDMTVPTGAIYGFIGENGSGKSTTEKIICGLMPYNGGSVSLFGKPHGDEDARRKIGVLIEAPGCFGNYSVWNNMLLQAANIGLKNAESEVARVLKLVHMEGAASNKYKNCSLGMKQRIGIAMALLGRPQLLILDEPINGLDADGMRIMREVLVDVTQNGNATVLISSHVLGELEKIATHYGIIRGGKKIKELSAEQFDRECPQFVNVLTKDDKQAVEVLNAKFKSVRMTESGVRIYDGVEPQAVVKVLCENGVAVAEVDTQKIGLEEYYVDILNGKESV